MRFDKNLIRTKLRSWEKYLYDYRLPDWESIPDIGLYMEQVITLLKGYLDYLPPELKDEQVVTAAAINNYVRKRIIPEPVKKKYYRVHIAYLIIICSLKQSLSIPVLQTMIPEDLGENELRRFYTLYARRHRMASRFFINQVREVASGIFEPDAESEIAAGSTEELITSAAVVCGFSRLLAEKLLLLDGKSMNKDGND